jgi:hypothetical protein
VGADCTGDIGPPERQPLIPDEAGAVSRKAVAHNGRKPHLFEIR